MEKDNQPASNQIAHAQNSLNILVQYTEELVGKYIDISKAKWDYVIRENLPKPYNALLKLSWLTTNGKSLYFIRKMRKNAFTIQKELNSICSLLKENKVEATFYPKVYYSHEMEITFNLEVDKNIWGHIKWEATHSKAQLSNLFDYPQLYQ